MAEHFDAISTGLRSEAKLLLGCARTKIDAENAGIIIALLKENIDWSYLLHLASHHKLLPLLYQSLEAVAPTSIPETARAQLKEQIQAGIQGNLFLTKELLHLLDLFNKHSILVIPYKGPVLAVTVYRDLLLRPCNDLDILVHEHDILQAMDLLVSCGYEIIRPPSVSQTEKGLHPLQVNRTR